MSRAKVQATRSFVPEQPQLLSTKPEVIDKAAVLVILSLGYSKDIGRVHSRGHSHRMPVTHDCPSQFRDLRRASDHRKNRCIPEANDELGTNRSQFGFEPGLARRNLSPACRLMNSSLASLLKAEVLDRVCQIHGAAVQSDLPQGTIQDLPRGSDERHSLAILLVTRLLANQDHLGIRRTVSKDRLGRMIHIARTRGSYERLRGVPASCAFGGMNSAADLGFVSHIRRSRDLASTIRPGTIDVSGIVAQCRPGT